MWLVIFLFLSTSAAFCDHYDEGPIDVALNQNSGIIEMSETLEILFDLRINAECFGWCHIFAIGGRYPLLYTHGGAFVSEFLQYPSLYENHVDTSDFYESMIDGAYHSFHLKYTHTERIIKFDDITYIDRNDVHNNIIEHQSYDISTVWGSTVQHATNATIKNLCINPRYVVNIIPNATQSQIENTTTTERSGANAYKKRKDSKRLLFWLVCLGVLIGLVFSFFGCVTDRMQIDDMNEHNGYSVQSSADEDDANDTQKVKEWLIMIGLEEYYDVFMRNGLCSLRFISKIRNEKDLYNIGIKLKGHQIVIMAEIENLKNLIEDGNDDMDEGINRDTKDEGNTVAESNIII